MKSKSNTPQSAQIRTPLQARNWFRAHGVAISDWCKAQNLDYQVVKDVLYGRSKGMRGKAHAAAIALRIKPDPESIGQE